MGREVAESSRTRDQMAYVVSQMETTLGQLEGDSKRLREGQAAVDRYAEKLDSASKVLGHLKKKTEEDSRYILWSFGFFMSVVAYIVLRRLKVFRLLYFGASSTWWAGSTTAGVIGSVFTRLADVYESFCLTF